MTIDLYESLYPVLLTVAIAIACAILLTLASIIFFVPTNEKVAKVREHLAGANCGACGFAGCDDYANALAHDKTLPCNKCAPAGPDAAKAIAEILGVSAGATDPMKAVVKCSGYDSITKSSMDYQGIKTCAAAKDFFGGPGECKYSCIGFGDCVKACPFNAIEICNGIAKVNREICVGCGACANACPKKIIDIIPENNRVYVGCSSLDPGLIVNKICSVGCIGCKLCEKECRFDAIKVEDGLARIDPSLCKNCGLCAKKCPRHIIHVIARPDQKVETKVEA